MNILIIGAGNIGFELAKILPEESSILLIARKIPKYVSAIMKTNSNIHFASGDATQYKDMETQ